MSLVFQQFQVKSLPMTAERKNKAAPPRNSPELVDQLVNANIKLAYFFANKSYDIDPDEALSRALKGLQHAAEQWDETRGRFATIASWKIRASLGRVRQDRSTLRRGGNVVTVSLNDLVGEDGAEIGDFVADDCSTTGLSEVLDDDNKRVLEELLQKLPEKLRVIVTLRFGLNGQEKQTLEQIGEIYAVTRERIRQLEAEGIEKLAFLFRNREKLGDEANRQVIIHIPKPTRVRVVIPFSGPFEIVRIKSYRDVLTSSLSPEERSEVKHLLKFGCSHTGPRGFYGRNKQRSVEAVPLFEGGSVATRQVARTMGITERLATRFRLAANLPKYEGRCGFYVPPQKIIVDTPP